MNQDSPTDRADSREGVSRRRAMRVALGAGIAAASLTLGACAGSKRRVMHEGRLGQPIPPDPVLTRTHPIPTGATTRFPTPTPARPAAPSNLVLIERSSWTNAAPRRWLANSMSGVGAITVHHDGIHPMPSVHTAECARRLDSIRRGHLSRGWADIGYHYSIDPAGRIWACRPLDLQGAHVKDRNPHNLGIMLMGDFNQASPTPQARQSLAALISAEMRRYNVPLSRVRTHQELAPTQCPGRSLQYAMNLLRAPGGGLA